MKNINEKFIIPKKTFLYWNYQTHWDHLSATAYTQFLIHPYAATKLLMLEVLEYICTQSGCLVCQSFNHSELLFPKAQSNIRVFCLK